MLEQEQVTQEKIAGTIERITFHNKDNGFCVLRTKVKGHRDLVTVTGNAATISVGEYIECKGSWYNDKKHGLQFKADSIQLTQPTTLEGIEKYLASGLIKGIGPQFAKKLVKAFGQDVFEVIEETPERLSELEGIGQKKITQLLESWKEQKSIRDIMVFLQTYDVGTARAVRIYKTYGAKAIKVVMENPYRLALDIRGIGFKIADQLAMKLGIPHDSLIRAEAGCLHVLQNMCDAGHCAVPYEDLVEQSAKLLDIQTSIIKEALLNGMEHEHLVLDEINGEACVYLMSLYQAEIGVANQIEALLKGILPWGKFDYDKAIDWVEGVTQLELSESQRTAVHNVISNKVSILTGGPGVGKTTVVNSIVKIIAAKKITIALAAPTGRAAKRLSESTALEAKTIHRLLEYDHAQNAFRYNEDNQLPIDFLIVDEASMLDITLFHSLLKAIPNTASLLLVGDIDQLPSVGPGSVLSDLIKSDAIHTSRLTEIFRQALDSKIIVNAYRVNSGEMPLDNEPDTDFFTIYQNSPEAVFDKLIKVVTQHIPAKFGFDPIADIQVLTPMNRGGLGTRSLNIELQKLLNGKQQAAISKDGWTYAVGDKVIQNVNNYDKEVFNGDIGFIHSLDVKEKHLQIQFDGRLVDYEASELDEIALAYAISIHKSQGSEYPVVVIPLVTQHYLLLARNLLYTGITRGKQLVVLIAQKRACELAVENVNARERLTHLADLLTE